MNSRTGWTRVLQVLVVGVVCMAFALSVSAQVETKTSATSDKAMVSTKVESGTVVTVSGNDLVVQMSDGTIRHFANVSESARVTVDGKQLGIHDLQPGMKLERTITTTTVPKTITTVQSVTGKVWHVNPPNSVILTLEDGTNQSFKIPKGQKFNVDGQMTDAFGLKKGMTISATKVVEVPVTVIEEQRRVTGSMPPPPPAPPANVPILVVIAVPVAAPAPAPAPESPVASAELPKTGSQLPLVGMLGLLLLASSLGLRAVRPRG
jgi:LPXTG-motif cell wall-anchored protein